jgi:hypothetical protein
MYGEQIIGEPGVKKDVKVADILSNSIWSLPIGANKHQQ